MENDRMDEMSEMDFSPSASRSSRLLWLAGGALLGVGIMYILDPAQGRRRRGIWMDRSNRAFQAVRQRLTPADSARRTPSAGSEVTARGEYVHAH